MGKGRQLGFVSEVRRRGALGRYIEGGKEMRDGVGEKRDRLTHAMGKCDKRNWGTQVSTNVGETEELYFFCVWGWMDEMRW